MSAYSKWLPHILVTYHRTVVVTGMDTPELSLLSGWGIMDIHCI